MGSCLSLVCVCWPYVHPPYRLSHEPQAPEAPQGAQPPSQGQATLGRACTHDSMRRVSLFTVVVGELPGDRAFQSASPRSVGARGRTSDTCLSLSARISIIPLAGLKLKPRDPSCWARLSGIGICMPWCQEVRIARLSVSSVLSPQGPIHGTEPRQGRPSPSPSAHPSAEPGSLASLSPLKPPPFARRTSVG